MRNYECFYQSLESKYLMLWQAERARWGSGDFANPYFPRRNLYQQYQVITFVFVFCIFISTDCMLYFVSTKQGLTFVFVFCIFINIYCIFSLYQQYQVITFVFAYWLIMMDIQSETFEMYLSNDQMLFPAWCSSRRGLLR